MWPVAKLPAIRNSLRVKSSSPLIFKPITVFFFQRSKIFLLQRLEDEFSTQLEEHRRFFASSLSADSNDTSSSEKPTSDDGSRSPSNITKVYQL